MTRNQLHTLWEIGAESFSALIEGRLGAAGAEDGAVGHRSMPGDGLLPGARSTETRNIEIDAQPETVWPWIAQMMRGGGIYGWPLLETSACRSADYLLDHVAAPRQGDRVNGLIELVLVETGRELVWRSVGETVVLNHVLDAPTIDYLLEPAVDDRTLLTARVRGAGRRLTDLISRHLVHVVVRVLTAPQLSVIKRCVETYPSRLARGQTNRRHVERHQAALFHPAGTVTAI